MESAIRSGGAECAMYRVEGNGVDSEDLVLIPVVGVRLAMTLEGEVESVMEVSVSLPDWSS